MPGKRDGGRWARQAVGFLVSTKGPELQDGVCLELI